MSVEQRAVGDTGLRVSRLGIGTMTWGRDTDDHEARAILSGFVDVGGSLVIARTCMPMVSPERLLGRLIAEMEIRDRVVIARRRCPAPVRSDASTPSLALLMSSLDKSLRRLGVGPHRPVADARLGSVDAHEETPAVADDAGAQRQGALRGRVELQRLVQTAVAMWQRAPPVGGAGEHPDGVIPAARGVERGDPRSPGLGMGVLSGPRWAGVLTGKYREGCPTTPGVAVRRSPSRLFSRTERSKSRGGRRCCDRGRGSRRTPLEIALTWVRDGRSLLLTAPIVRVRTAEELPPVLATEDTARPQRSARHSTTFRHSRWIPGSGLEPALSVSESEPKPALALARCAE